MSEHVSHASEPPLLLVKDLKVHFDTNSGWFSSGNAIRAVDGVSFTLRAGETLGLVGESGCGKSTTARAILNLVPPTAGSIEIAGTRTSGLSAKAMRPHRRNVQMIFQDPFASLNPRMTIGRIIAEPMEIFRLHSSRQRQF